MDTNTAVVIVVALFAVVAIGAYFVYRNRADVSIKGPFGTGVEVKGENPQEQPRPKQEQAMKASKEGEQEMAGSGADQKQRMEGSEGGKQKMS